MTTSGEDQAAGPMSVRAYARRRGVSAPAVLNAIKAGRLRASLVSTPGGMKIADPDLADREWDENTDLSRAPGYVRARAEGRSDEAPAPPSSDDEKPMSLLEASALEKQWNARLAELKYHKETQGLVDAAKFKERLVEVHTRARTKLLGLPAKMKTAIPVLTRADLVTVDRLIREALEELSTQGDEA